MSNKIDIQVRLTIPDNEPYEGKATQKQKQRIWELGFQDQAIIDDLGKKQASAVIEQLSEAYREVGGRRSTKIMFIWSLVLLLASFGAIVGGRFSYAIRESDLASAIGVFGLFIGAFLLLWSLLRRLGSALKKK